jgi:hypothetical protein
MDRWDTPAEKRAHRKAQAKYQKSPEEVQKRENRNKARQTLIRAGKAHVGDGKDVMHINGNALDNKPSNWRNGSRHANRSYARTPGGHKVNPRS